MNATALATALLAASLAAILLLELRPGPPPDPVAASSPRAAPPGRPLPAPAERADLAKILTTRPLFSATRRPAIVPADGAAADTATSLPRMTGILIDGSRRSAIFAPPDGRPVVVGEGGQIGAFTVQRIEPQLVTVLGPEGPQTVRTRFDPALPPPAAAQPATPPALPPAGPQPGLFALPGAAR